MEAGLAGRLELMELPPEADPEEQLRRVEGLQKGRARHCAMKELGDRLLELGAALLRELPEAPPDSPLEGLRGDLDKLRQADNALRPVEEVRIHAVQEVLGEVANDSPRTRQQQKLLDVAERVKGVSREMQQLEQQATYGPRTRLSQMAARLYAPPVHVVSAEEAAARIAKKRDAEQMAAMRYQMARTAARNDISAQNEAIEMAKELASIFRDGPLVLRRAVFVCWGRGGQAGGPAVASGGRRVPRSRWVGAVRRDGSWLVSRGWAGP
ncbi:hypothetical protein RJT17_35845 [Streptomyces sp. P5-A9]|uniref:hypothetical protein n=1 Tax=Streptomyces sp. P5-A9 TaxID=3071730 RepID=UPI002FC84CAF